jgi:hypothetical protein
MILMSVSVGMFGVDDAGSRFVCKHDVMTQPVPIMLNKNHFLGQSRLSNQMVEIAGDAAHTLGVMALATLASITILALNDENNEAVQHGALLANKASPHLLLFFIPKDFHDSLLPFH